MDRRKRLEHFQRSLHSSASSGIEIEVRGVKLTSVRQAFEIDLQFQSELKSYDYRNKKGCEFLDNMNAFLQVSELDRRFYGSY